MIVDETTISSIESDIIPNRSSGYELVGDKLQNQAWVSPAFTSTADRTFYFNIIDPAKWDEALYGTTLLKQSSLDRISTVFPLNDGKPNSDNYGFAWETDAVNGHKVIEHGGAWQGFACHISRYVGDSMTMAVLTNLDAAEPNQIAQTIAGLLIPVLVPPPPKEHKEIAIDPKLLDGYVGRYQLAPNFIVTVTRKDNRLFVQATGQQELRYPRRAKANFSSNVDAQITFTTDSQGLATELILHRKGESHARRIK